MPMTTDGQSASHRLVRVMATAILAMVAAAFALYAFAAWSATAINCAPDSETAAFCGGSRMRMWVFAALTLAALSGAVTAWRKLNA